MNTELARAQAELNAAWDAALAARGGREGLAFDHGVSVDIGTRRECWAYLDGAKTYLAIAEANYNAGDPASGDLHLAVAETWVAIASMCYHRAGLI